jgi:hypothetical protein
VPAMCRTTSETPTTIASPKMIQIARHQRERCAFAMKGGPNMRFYPRISLIERRWGLERFRKSPERPPAGRCHLIGMPPQPAGAGPRPGIWRKVRRPRTPPRQITAARIASHDRVAQAVGPNAVPRARRCSGEASQQRRGQASRHGASVIRK